MDFLIRGIAVSLLIILFGLVGSNTQEITRENDQRNHSALSRLQGVWEQTSLWKHDRKMEEQALPNLLCLRKFL